MTSRWDNRVTRRVRAALATAAAGALLATGAAPAATASAAVSPAQVSPGDKLGGRALQQSLDAVHEAGLYGLYAAVRDGSQAWRGAAGVADVVTRRPVRPDMTHRVGSISKTFVSVAILQQVARGTIDLDAPVARYLPGLIPGERGRRITVRMLLDHTSHIGDFVAGAFPSLVAGSGASLDEHRFRRITPMELVRFGLDAAPTGEPGATPGSYANVNYVIAGLVLQKVTGVDAEQYITRNVIRKAGLRHTSFPRTPFIPGPHSKAYESLYGLIDPPRDYSVYDMSWAYMAGAIVSTMDDLNRFYRVLLRGKLIDGARLAEMQKTVPVSVGGFTLDYGLGIYPLDLPCGRFWGHDGGVFGMLTQSLTSQDGRRQASFGLNLSKYQHLNDDGTLEPSPIDDALVNHLLLATCGPGEARTLDARRVPLFPTAGLAVKR
ncbi:serine hydrolase domain-containing protein [Nonomuraea rhizosphaerae]|uniref:serine hydrolase domain-containing protein n=1 Tax=Nonomuraea rhizosphaerae TaxID=2665663 RepID=UPI001C5EC66F|nr:serine hydrolase domain-containing protein [Nonomuraea rhizosphaerae]